MNNSYFSCSNYFREGEVLNNSQYIIFLLALIIVSETELVMCN